MFFSDPDIYPSRIPDPTTTQKRRGNQFCCPTFFVATNMTKSSQIYGLGFRIRYPGYGNLKNLLRIPNPGVKKARDHGTGSATLPFVNF
jgi:hypothetical protein